METTFKITNVTKLLSRKEEEFLKDTVKNGAELQCSGRMTTDAIGNPYVGWFIPFVAKEGCTDMCRSICEKMRTNRLTWLINYYDGYDGNSDFILINNTRYKLFKEWANKK